MSQYDAVALRTLAVITKKGGPLTFPGVGTEPIYDPLTDTWSGGSAGTDVIGRAVQIDGDVDRFAALKLVLVNPVTVMVAAQGLGHTPVVGGLFTWAGTQYTIRDVDSVIPDGVTRILWTITGTT